MKKNKRFVTGAVTAAMVATAVVPGAAAASFTDIGHLDKETKAELDRAVELKIMGGIGKEFQPNKPITRGQVAKALAKYIAGKEGKTIEQYYKDHNLLAKVKSFDDVSSKAADQELFQAGLIVKDAKVFEGVNNQLNPTQSILRQHMATVIVRAFHLEKTNEPVAIKDLNQAVNQHRASIEILAQHEITKPVNGQFKPNETVKRIHMASFLVRAYDQSEVKDIQVDTVQASTEKVKKAANQELLITINNDEVVSVKELREAGYTVEFKYNQTASKDAKEKGIVDASVAPFSSDFEYQVVVQKEGKKAIASEWKKVQVLDAKTPVTVEEVRLVQAGEKFPVPYLTTTDVGTTVEAVTAKNAFDETINVTLPTVKNIKTSNALVAYYENGALVPKKAGKVQLAIEFEGIQGEFTYDLEIKEGQQPAFKTTPKKVPVEQGVDHVLTYELVDQYGEKLRSDVELAVTKDAETAVTQKVTAGQPLVLNVKAATGTALYKVAHGTTHLGTVEVEAKEVKPEAITTFELVSDATIIDMKNPANATLALTVNGYADGVKASVAKVQEATKNWEFISDNPKVATVDAQGKVTAVAPGATTIHLAAVQGEKVTKKASYTVEVVNTTTQINSLELVGETKAIVVNDAAKFFTDANQEDVKKYVAAFVTAGKDDKGAEIFGASYIDHVKYIAANKQIIVTINASNGGKQFVFDVKEDEKASMYAKVKEVKRTNSSELTFTFTEAVQVANDFKVTGRNHKEAALSADKKSVKVTLNSDVTVGQTVEATGITDAKTGIAVAVNTPVTK